MPSKNSVLLHFYISFFSWDSKVDNQMEIPSSVLTTSATAWCGRISSTIPQFGLGLSPISSQWGVGMNSVIKLCTKSCRQYLFYKVMGFTCKTKSFICSEINIDEKKKVNGLTPLSISHQSILSTTLEMLKWKHSLTLARPGPSP